MKLKTCRICKTKFEPVRFAQTCCSVECAIHHAIALRTKESKKQYKDAKEKLKSLTDYANEAQTVFNKWIRLRDSHLPCISCQRHHNGQHHAGHYRSVGAARHLRFNENNVHKQCSVCNNHMSGNITAYRINLVKKIGADAVEDLENNNDIRKFTIEELIEIKKEYNKRIKEFSQLR